MNNQKAYTKNRVLREIKRQASFWLALIVILVSACDNSSSDGGPLGPSNSDASASLVQVTPSTATVVKADTLTFTGSGGTGTYTWSVSDATKASIVSTFCPGKKT